MKNHLNNIERFLKETYRCYEKIRLPDRIELHLYTCKDSGVEFAFNPDGSLIGISPQHYDFR